MRIKNSQVIEKYSVEYQNRIRKCLIMILSKDYTVNDIIMDDTDDGYVKIEFCLTKPHSLFGLTDYGVYTSFGHKQENWFWKFLGMKEYYRFTFKVNK